MEQFTPDRLSPAVGFVHSDEADRKLKSGPDPGCPHASVHVPKGRREHGESLAESSTNVMISLSPRTSGRRTWTTCDLTL